MEKTDSMTPERIDLAFDVFAEEYDALAEFQYETGLALMEVLGIGLGMEVLDVGCGTSKPTLEIAREVGRRGKVVGVDIALQRLKVAKRNVQKAVLENIEFIHCQPENLPFPQPSFDLSSQIHPSIGSATNARRL